MRHDGKVREIWGKRLAQLFPFAPSQNAQQAITALYLNLVSLPERFGLGGVEGFKIVGEDNIRSSADTVLARCASGLLLRDV